MSPAYRSFLETIFATYTVIFIGFGGDDLDLNSITDKLSALYEHSIGQHFLLIPNNVFSNIERRRLLEDKRLDCVEYEKDDTHSQVIEFLKALSYGMRPDIPTISSPFTGDEEKPRVFVSGSYQNIELLRDIATLVKEAGFESWLAEAEIQPGDIIQDSISKAIYETDCMIIVITKESATSNWVSFEIQRAFAANKLIFPIRVGDASLPGFLRDILYLQVSSEQLSAREKMLIAGNLKKLLKKIAKRMKMA